jgi:predicted HicB family RNase H-like nuclease
MHKQKQAKARKAGRPPLPKGYAKARIVPIRVSLELFRGITAAAKATKVSVSEWIRSTLEAAIKE